MADEINMLWEKLSIFEEQSKTIAISNESLTNPVQALVERFAMKKNIGVVELEGALKCIWDLELPSKIVAIGEGLFLFEFFDASEYNMIL